MIKERRLVNRVVITGLGIVSPIGVGKIEFCNSLKNGVVGIDKISLFNPADLPSIIGAEIKDFNPGKYLVKKNIKKLGRAAHLAIGAAQLAIEDACLNMDASARENCPVFVGTAVGGMDFAEENFLKIFNEGSRKISTYAGVAVFCASISSAISMDLSLHGKSISVSNGCCSSTDAVAQAFDFIKSKQGDTAICGGADACVTKGVLAAFCKMGVVTTHYNHTPKKACKPFHRRRDGFALGEGAWIIVLESLDKAVARKANVYAEIVGYGATCDAYHPSAPHSDGLYNKEAIKIAIDSADMEPDDIDCISAYGNATNLNDPLETRVYKEVFSNRVKKIPISSIKSMIGHPIGATGAAQIIAAALSIAKNFIPPTMNLDDPDPACDLDYVPNKSREMKVNNILINTLSFGGKNSCLILKRV